jgi:hypothetical protein
MMTATGTAPNAPDDRLTEAIRAEAMALAHHAEHAEVLAADSDLHTYHAAELLFRLSRVNGQLLAAFREAKKAVDEAKKDRQPSQEHRP